MSPIQLHIFVVIAFLVGCTIQDTPCTQNAVINDDPTLNQIVAKARSQFLASRPHPFDRLDTTLLIPQSDGTWKRGGFNQNEVSYPASCIKLTYLVSAVHWCQMKYGKDQYDCLDQHVRGMITVSDNEETGVIVDTITGAPNIPLTQKNDTFFQWLAARNFTQKWFAERGMLENQTLLHKTFPTNSGNNPNGAEQLAREYKGMNAMNSKCAASLMLEIISGKIVPEARKYMMQVLNHQRFHFTTYGYGLPPGSLMYNKLGNAYDTLEEISYIVLPNKKDFILASFTNGFEFTEPSTNTLSYFVELLMDQTGLSDGNPTRLIFDTSSSNFYITGSDWYKGVNAHDKYGDFYMYNNDPHSSEKTAGWKFSINETGLYEVAWWGVEYPDHASDVSIVVNSGEGKTTLTNVNQQKNGGRWDILGDWNFEAGGNYSIYVIAKTTYSKKIIFANAIKITKWPNCGPIPGTTCVTPPKRY